MRFPNNTRAGKAWSVHLRSKEEQALGVGRMLSIKKRLAWVIHTIIFGELLDNQPSINGIKPIRLSSSHL